MSFHGTMLRKKPSVTDQKYTCTRGTSSKISPAFGRGLNLIMAYMGTSIHLYWEMQKSAGSLNPQSLSPLCKFYIVLLLVVMSTINVMTVFRWFIQGKHLVKSKILYFLIGYFFGQKMNVVDTSGKRLAFLALSTVLLDWQCVKGGFNSPKFLIAGLITSSALHMSDKVVIDIFPPSSLQAIAYTLTQYILPVICVAFTYGNSFHQEFSSYSPLVVSGLVNLIVMTIPEIDMHVTIARTYSYMILLLITFVCGIPYFRSSYHSRHGTWLLILSIVPLPFLLN